jgi:hypothetical protein
MPLHHRDVSLLDEGDGVHDGRFIIEHPAAHRPHEHGPAIDPNAVWNRFGCIALSEMAPTNVIVGRHSEEVSSPWVQRRHHESSDARARPTLGAAERRVV